jgi:hypothetical protein
MTRKSLCSFCSCKIPFPKPGASLAPPPSKMTSLLMCLSPGGLASNWTHECAKWFPPAELRIQPFSEYSAHANTRGRIIYTVGIQETMCVETLPAECYVAAAVGDEWHIYGRARPQTSVRRDRISHIMKQTTFVLQMSGTFFPLGPKSDAEKLMINLGGDWTSHNDDSVKWSADERKQLKVIFKRQGNRLVNWSVIRLRRFLGQFLIRRSTSSRYRGKLIIPQKIARPPALPAAMPTGPCPVEESAQRWWRQELRTASNSSNRMIGFNQLKFNAAHAREIAWSELAVPFHQKKKTSRAEAMRDLRLAWPQQKFISMRIKKLGNLVKTCKKKGRRFIIAADSIFLVAIAYLVSLSLITHVDSLVVP